MTLSHLGQDNDTAAGDSDLGGRHNDTAEHDTDPGRFGRGGLRLRRRGAAKRVVGVRCSLTVIHAPCCVSEMLASDEGAVRSRGAGVHATARIWQTRMDSQAMRRKGTSVRCGGEG